MEGQEGGVGGKGVEEGKEITVHDTVHRLQNITVLSANGQTNPKLDQQAS